VYLQCYAGGANNSPSIWSSTFSGLRVGAGLWADKETPSQVKSKLTNWKNSLDGGWIWLFDEIMRDEGEDVVKDYGDAVNDALK